MQSGIFRPVNVTVHPAIGGCVVQGYEKDTNCFFTIHFDSAADAMAFGRAVSRGAWEAFRGKVAERCVDEAWRHAEAPVECGENAP